MAKFTYNPQDGAEITTIFGKVVEAGDSVEITDERQIEKLKNHPEFQSKTLAAQSQEQAREDEKLAKAIDGRSKQARQAREKADAAEADAAAAERARVQAAAIAEARAEDEPFPANES